MSVFSSGRHHWTVELRLRDRSFDLGPDLLMDRSGRWGNFNGAGQKPSMKSKEGSRWRQQAVRLMSQQAPFQIGGVLRHGIAAKPINNGDEEVKFERTDLTIVDD